MQKSGILSFFLEIRTLTCEFSSRLHGLCRNFDDIRLQKFSTFSRLQKNFRKKTQTRNEILPDYSWELKDVVRFCRAVVTSHI